MTAPITTEEFRALWAKTISEDAFQAQVIEMARALGWMVAHFRTARIQRKDGSVHYATPVEADGAGFPDCVFAGRRVMYAELKAARGKVRLDQLVWLEALQRAGQEAFLWFPADMEEIESALSGAVAHPTLLAGFMRVRTLLEGRRK